MSTPFPFLRKLRCLIALVISLATPLGRVNAAPPTPAPTATAGAAAGVPQAPAAPGDLDPFFGGFGVGGQVKVVGHGMGPGRRGLALQADGKIVTAGYSGVALLVMRFLSNGSPDATFGAGGILTLMDASVALRGTSVAVQADGKIVVAGWADSHPTNFMLARLTASGALDHTFGADGYVFTDFDSDTDQADSVLIQPDGKIVAAGRAKVGGDFDFAVARYNPDGSLDTSFSSDGKATVGFGGDDAAMDLARQSDGKLVLVGGDIGSPIDGDFEIARLNFDGSLDSSFSGDGKLTDGFTLSGFWEVASAVAIQPDGAIVVAGQNSPVEGCCGAEVLVARYLPNGDLDNSFDGDGQRRIAGLSGYLYDLALQPDGKVVLAGVHESLAKDNNIALYRLNANGSSDATFDGDGAAFFDIGGNDLGYALAVQPDGRLVIYGDSDSNHVLLRLWPDGSFDTAGRQALGFADPLFGLDADETAYAVAVQSDNRIVVAGEVTNPGATASNLVLARFLYDGELDTSFGDNGRVWFGFGQYNVARAMLIQPDGQIVVAGSSDPIGGVESNFLIARFNANGSPDHNFGPLGLGFNVIDFAGGADYGTALALAPDGKLVVAGEAWNGSRNVFGVARLLDNGALDPAFNGDGKTLFEWVPTNWASAVVVQPDRKIVVGGHVALDFALVRFKEDGAVDSTFGSLGTTITDMGGSDDLRALLLAPNGEFFAAGVRDLGSGGDFALAQYDPGGHLTTCSSPPCLTWGKIFLDFGAADAAMALDWRDDGHIVVAGCSGQQFAWAQVRTTLVASPIKFTTDFPSNGQECAFGVKYYGSNKIVMAGVQTFDDDANMALARFETTVNPNAPIFRLFLPNVRR